MSQEVGREETGMKTTRLWGSSQLKGGLVSLPLRISYPLRQRGGRQDNRIPLRAPRRGT